MYLFFLRRSLHVAVARQRAADGSPDRMFHFAPTKAQEERHPTFFLRAHPPGSLDPSRVYVGTHFEAREVAMALAHAGDPEAMHVLRADVCKRVLRLPQMPIGLRYEAVGPARFAPLQDVVAEVDALARSGTRPVRVAVINPGSHAYGDTLVSATALRSVRVALEAAVRGSVQIDLLQQAGSRRTRPYADAGGVDRIRMLPIPLQDLQAYDAHIDLSTQHVQPGKPWIDAMLEACRVDPSSVPAAQKRNRLAAPPAVHPAVQAVLARPEVQAAAARVLVHPTASTAVRSMPPQAHARLVDALLEARPDLVLVSALPSGITHDRFVDASPASSSFDHFLDLLRAMDAFVSVDTATYHYADALGVPGLVLFTTIPPEERVAYYPDVQGLRVGQSEALEGLHWSTEPEARAAAEAMWDAFDPSPVVRWLRAAVPA